MRMFSVAFILFFSCSYVYAFEKMTEPEMKDATAQLASAVGDLSGAVGPVTMIAGDAGPMLAPIGPVAYFYDLVSPHVDPVLQAQETSSTAEPVTRIMRVGGDLSVFGSFF